LVPQLLLLLAPVELVQQQPLSVEMAVIPYLEASQPLAAEVVERVMLVYKMARLVVLAAVALHFLPVDLEGLVLLVKEILVVLVLLPMVVAAAAAEQDLLV
jgi:hypothetical protein